MVFIMKAELHCHSIYSDGTLAPAEIMRLAKAKRIGAVALTDHNTISGHAEAEREAKKNGIIFIPGEEISSSDGHILALGINKCVKRGMPAEKTIKIIHRLGGIAVFAHPYGQLFASKGNVEKARFFDAIEVNARSLPMENRKAAQLAKKLGLPLVTGSDSHTKEEFGLFV